MSLIKRCINLKYDYVRIISKYYYRIENKCQIQQEDKGSSE